ncbi:MAG: hypothetical protein PHQ14_08310 [Chromatiales bacterium]|nr:hypothetical protein [Chromatiales bacterium]
MRKYLLLALLLAGLPAQAHLLKVFAYAEGAQIEGNAYFAGGGKAGGAHIQIFAGDDRLLAEPAPDAEGNFRYTARERIDHRIVANTGDGHRAEWTITAEQLPPTLPAPGGAANVASMPAAEKSAGVPATTADDSVTNVTADEIEARVARAVAAQLRPLREELQRHDEQVRLRDVLGGIGYILGLAGLVLWWRSRGKRP